MSFMVKIVKKLLLTACARFWLTVHVCDGDEDKISKERNDLYNKVISKVGGYCTKSNKKIRNEA